MADTFIAIDLKSFYASVECTERGLDPLTTNLVVADISRTEKTICLAVSPSMKSYGIPGRARLFEVVQRVREVNCERRKATPGHCFSGSSFSSVELKAHPELSLDYIAAPPRMAFYLEYSTRIYNIYLEYFSPQDIHVYSVDEVFIDATKYLSLYNITARELTMEIIHRVLKLTGITATAGIGTNLYLCKIAMDIGAKRIAPDKDGVRIAQLDELSYRQTLWTHRPLTDFWRIGNGYSKKLEAHGLYTMGDIALCSLGKKTEYYNEDLLYKLFGINAELLIDHAWGREPCTMEAIKTYRPTINSISSGQVLSTPYIFDKARLIVHEMADSLSLELAGKYLVTPQITLSIGYDSLSISDNGAQPDFTGEYTTDRYGRRTPKGAHGSVRLEKKTSSTKYLTDAATQLFERITDRQLKVRRVNITAENVTDERAESAEYTSEQLTLFSDYEEIRKQREQRAIEEQREKQIQNTVIGLKKRYGKNAVLKGINLSEGATTLLRNSQIGGHRA